MLRPLLLAALLAVRLAFPSGALAQADTPEAEPSGAALRAGLSSPRFTGRQQAMLRLWADPENAREQVERLAAAGDPETAARAGWILQQWQLGITPETPVEVRALLREASEGQGQGRGRGYHLLLVDGRIEPIVQLLRVAEPEVVEQVVATVVQWMPRVAFHLLRADREADLLRLIDAAVRPPDPALVADPRRRRLAFENRRQLCIRRAEMLFAAGRPVDEASRLPPPVEQWPADQRAVVEVAVLAACDALPAAVERAAETDQLDLQLILLAKSGRWSELAAAAVAAGDDPRETDAVTRLERWSLAAFAARQADAAEPFDRAVDRLAGTRAEPDVARGAAVGLLAAGEVPTAVELLRQADPGAAAHLLSSRTEYDQAMRAIGVRPESIAEDLERLADTAQRAEDDARHPLHDRAFDTAAYAARLALRTGFLREAHQTYGRLAVIPSGDPPPRQRVLRELLRIDRPQWAIDFAVSKLPSEKEGPTVAGWLFPEPSERGEVSAGELVWRALPQVVPEADVRRRAEIALHLGAGRLPAGWGRHGRLDQLAAAFPEQESASRLFGASGPLIAMFENLGRPDLAAPYSQWRAEFGGPLGMGWGETLLAERRYDEAAEAFRRAWEGDSTSSMGGQRRRPVLARFANYPPALAGWAEALRKQGRTGEAERLDAILDRMPLTPSQHRAVAERLDQYGRQSRAIAHLRVAYRAASLDVEDTSDHGRWEFSIASRLAGLTESERPAEAIGWRQRVLASVVRFRPPLDSSSIAWVVGQSALIQRQAGELAARQGDPAAARRHFLAGLRWVPADITLAEEVGLRLREHGYEKLADELVDRVARVLVEHLDKFPRDASAANNLAWLLARNDRRLDEALRYASRAVAIYPDSTAYRDTLAEALHRLGRTDEALRIERQCLLDEPDDWHLHEQIERFERERTSA